MRHSIFLGILIALLGIAVVSFAAPVIGLETAEDFVIWKPIGVNRHLAVLYPLALTLLLCVYQVLSIGIFATPASAKWRAVLQAASTEGAKIFSQLTGQPNSPHPQEWRKVAILAAVFLAAFVILLSQYVTRVGHSSDQVWHQAFVDYDVDWRTPIFSFAGNVLNNFGIQLPLNTQLLPVLGLSELFAHDQHILAAVVLFFIAMAMLFWAIGAAWGIPPVLRAIFAGLVALVVSVPQGLHLIFWLLPPNFFTSQFVLALWWQEAPYLFLVTILFFYWIGQGKFAATNILCSIGFAFGCFLAVLGYPVGGVYFVPLIGFYCLTFFFTSVGRAEWIWKGAVCAVVAVAMLTAKVPQFFINLYAYSFGSYFRDLIRFPVLSYFQSTFMITYRGGDLRADLVFIVSIATVGVVAFRGDGRTAPVRDRSSRLRGCRRSNR